MSKNYMDRYETAEQFIRAEILANRHSGCIVTRRMMIDKLIPKVGKINFNRLGKPQLFDLLQEHYGDEVYTMFPGIGVYAVSFQNKFGLTRGEVTRLEKAGLIKVTGKRRLRNGVEYKIFSAMDYFRLTWGEVIVALERLRKADSRNTVTEGLPV